jgi:hypothetical protein
MIDKVEEDREKAFDAVTTRFAPSRGRRPSG